MSLRIFCPPSLVVCDYTVVFGLCFCSLLFGNHLFVIYVCVGVCVRSCASCVSVCVCRRTCLRVFFFYLIRNIRRTLEAGSSIE